MGSDWLVRTRTLICCMSAFRPVLPLTALRRVAASHRNARDQRSRTLGSLDLARVTALSDDRRRHGTEGHDRVTVRAGNRDHRRCDRAAGLEPPAWRPGCRAPRAVRGRRRRLLRPLTGDSARHRSGGGSDDVPLSRLDLVGLVHGAKLACLQLARSRVVPGMGGVAALPCPPATKTPRGGMRFRRSPRSTGGGFHADSVGSLMVCSLHQRRRSLRYRSRRFGLRRRPVRT